MGPGQVRPAASRVRRHEPDWTEHPVGARRDPAAYGLKGVGFETYTGDGPISYWNSYVGVSQMGGQGNFRDPRIGLFIRQTPDLVTPKLGALLEYQLRLRAPEPPDGSFNRRAAQRGRRVFRNEAGCARCHSGPTFTDVLERSAKESARSCTIQRKSERIPCMRAEAQRASTGRRRCARSGSIRRTSTTGARRIYRAVVNHYDQHFGLKLTPDQKFDLVEFLKSL